MNTTLIEARTYYEKAMQLGKKEGGSPLILDHILKEKGIHSATEFPLGLQTIHLDQIVGTKSEGRMNCFSKSFYPRLNGDSEFAQKWCNLCQSHMNEGIRDAVKVYEYMNEFYVLEGNKRVSILKYFDAVTIAADVIRIMPPQIDRPDIVTYYKFLDFYNLSHINYLYFTKPGRFELFHRLIGKNRNELWTDDDRMICDSIYARFRQEYSKLVGPQHYTKISDAFLYFISIYDYATLIHMPMKEMQANIKKCKEEFSIIENPLSSNPQLDPSDKKANPLLVLLPKSMQKLKIAFIHDKSAESSGWTFNHDNGRMHIEKVFKENVSTTVYNNTDINNIEETIQDAIDKKHQVIFTTSPIFLKATLKAAMDHPKIKFLNCTTHTPMKHVRTYYARMYEVKFLLGAIAGAITENDKIGYIADYPIYGTLSNINAFALGAKMVNPRAKIYLEWSKIHKNEDGSEQTMDDIYDSFRRQEIRLICDKDSLNAKEFNKRVGLYLEDENGLWNIALPVWDWDIFYEKTIYHILNNTYKNEESSDKSKGISYWWGMSSGIVNIFYSSRLPMGTIRLIDLLKETIMRGNFNPFSGLLYSQERVIQSDKDAVLSPEQILTMDWLADSVIGSIPDRKDLVESAQLLSEFLGVDEKENVL